MTILHDLHRSQQKAREIFASEADKLGLTPVQFALLSALQQEPGASQTRLVELTGVDRSTLADVVRRLLSKRLITRRRTKEDARTYAVTLTDTGAQLMAQSRSSLEVAVNRQILALVSPRHQKSFLAALAEIASAKVWANGH